MSILGRLFNLKLSPKELGCALSETLSLDRQEAAELSEVVSSLDIDDQIRILMELHHLKAFIVDFGVYSILGQSQKKSDIMHSFLTEVVKIASNAKGIYTEPYNQFLHDLPDHSKRYRMMLKELNQNGFNDGMFESAIIVKTFLDLAQVPVPYGITRDKLQTFVYIIYNDYLNFVRAFIKDKA